MTFSSLISKKNQTQAKKHSISEKGKAIFKHHRLAELSTIQAFAYS